MPLLSAEYISRADRGTHRSCSLRVPASLLLLLTMAVPGGRASGQIVNIENILAGEPKPGIQAALQFGFGMKQGNSKFVQLEGSGLVRWRGGNQMVQVVLGGSYRTAQDRKVADNAIGHLRYGYIASPRLRVEVLAQVQRDAFLRLRRRVLVGAGFRTNLYSSPAAAATGGDPIERRLDLGLIVMHESEELQDEASEPGWRASVLVSLGWGLTETASLGSQIYIQPLLSDVGDVRVLSDAGLTVRLLGPLSTQVSARITYDSHPPAEVKTTDLLLRNTLVITVR